MRGRYSRLAVVFAAAVLVFSGCVPDDGGGTSSNQSPVAIAGSDTTSGQAPLLVQFTSSGSVDPDGFIESYEWNFGDGSPNSAAANPNHTYVAGGTFEATLTVTDNGGLTASASRTIVVAPPANVPPIAEISADTLGGKTPLTVNFGSSGSSDIDGSIVSQTWDFGDSSLPETGASVAHTFTAAGSYVVTLTVEDNDGATGTDSTIVTVADNIAPVASGTATPNSGKVPLFVSFSAAGSTDADGDVVAWSWDFDDGSTPATTENVIHQFTTVGTFDVVLTVTDNDGTTDTTHIPVVVNANQPPVGVVNATPDSGKAPLGVTFSSVGSNDPDGTIVGYAWDFGDGGSDTAANPSHLYAVQGNYTASLTLTDDDGATTTVTTQVVVGPPNVPPTAAGTVALAFGCALLSALAVLGFYGRVELAQALFLMLVPLLPISLMRMAQALEM